MKIELDGLTVRYTDEGNPQGEAVLVLHGWGGRIESMAPVIQGLLPTNRVIALDFPGFGESDPPPGPWSVTEYTALTVKLLKKLGVPRVHVIAHSFGGRVTLLMGKEHPELLGKVVITGGAGIRPKRGAKYYAKVWSYKLMKRVYRLLERLGVLEGVREALRERIEARAGSSDYRDAAGVMRQTFVKVVNQDLRYCLPHIKSPCLLFWGERDDAAPLYMGKIMEKEIPDAGLVVLPGAGHFAYLEEIGTFMAAVKHFLGVKA